MMMFYFDIIVFASICTVVSWQTLEMYTEKINCKIMWLSLLYMDSSWPKTNDKDKFQFRISE